MENQQNQELYAELLSLGFEENAIKRALTLTNDKEQAVELILNFQEDEFNEPQQENQDNFVPQGLDLQNMNLLGNLDPSQLLNMTGQNLQFTQQLPDKQYKMIFMVRMDLKMGVGKVAAQVGHAVMGAYHELLNKIDNEKDGKYKQCLETWEMYGQPKIVVKVETKEEFIELEKKARDIGINTYTVCDAGRTQVEPGSQTVCALGPATVDDIDSITKHLKLL